MTVAGEVSNGSACTPVCLVEMPLAISLLLVPNVAFQISLFPYLKQVTVIEGVLLVLQFLATRSNFPQLKHWDES